MLKKRIIPVITWDGITQVQTTQFTAMRRVGSVRQAVEVFGRRQPDELMILDVTASEKGRPPEFWELREFTEPLMCPVSIGGGISEPVEAVKLIRDGADKIVIGTNAERLLPVLAPKLGSQALVAALDHMGDLDDSLSRAQRYVTLGAGEILLTATLMQGREAGYDIELIERVSKAVSVPVIANGGASCPQDMDRAFKAGAHAVAAGTMFLFSQHTPASCAAWLSNRGHQVRVGA